MILRYEKQRMLDLISLGNLDQPSIIVETLGT
jgi:hypothetical protein